MKLFAQLSDDNLFQLLSNGDETAFTVLYERYAAFLFNIVIIKLKDEEAAKEIVQSVFISLWTSKKADIRDIKAYLSGAVYKQINNKFRSNSNIRGYQQEYGQLKDRYTTEVPIERKELNQELVAAINMITPASKEAFVKLYIQRKRIKEIALEMDINVQSVKNHIQHALKTLRWHLKKNL
jgi:RNA polymerase sigma-70 factor (ECF subfamily)